MPKGVKLTDRQELFCKEYLIDLNASQAAIRSGYSKKTADRIGWENLKKPELQKRLTELKMEREERLQVDADWVLEQAMEMYGLCREGGDSSNAKGFLEMCGKHVNVKAFDKGASINLDKDIKAINISFVGDDD